MMAGPDCDRSLHNGLMGIQTGSLMSAHSAWAKSWMPQVDDNDNKEKPQDEVRISVELLDTLETDDCGTRGDYSPNVLVTTLPIVGRVHLLKAKSGYITVIMIILYWIYGSWSTIFVILKPHYDDGQISGILPLYYAVISGLCITSFCRAVSSNPGRIPFSKEAAISIEDLTDNHCAVCRRRRPQRSHHCRRCGQCILRMDHHCPWINNCVGQENHWLFVQLLWYAYLMGTSTFIFCMFHIYSWPPCISCNPEAYTILHFRRFIIACVILSAIMTIFAGLLLLQHIVSFWLVMLEIVLSLSIGLALGMMGGSGGLLCLHLFSMVTDMTTIDWMKLQNKVTAKGGRPNIKDMPRPKRSCLAAHDDLCGGGPRLLWPFPCRKRHGPLYVSYPQIV